MNILFVGHYGGRNLGDEIILLSQIQQFNKEFKQDNTFYIFSYGQKFSLDLLLKYNIKVKTIKAFNFRNCYSSYIDQKNKIKEVDLIVLGGGGLIQDVYFSYGIFRYVLPCLIGYKLNKKIITYSLGVYRFNNKINRKIFSALLEFASVISVRDEVSKKECESLIAKKIYQIPDSALMFDIKTLPKNKISKNVSKQYNITIMLRDFFETHLEDLAFKINKLLRNISSLSMVIDIIIFENNNIERRIATKLKTLINSAQRKVFIKDNFDPVNYLLNLNNSDLVISGRLHGMIPSVILNKKFISLSYSPKMTSFCNENNYSFIEIDELKNSDIHFKEFINIPSQKATVGVSENSDFDAFNKEVKKTIQLKQNEKKIKNYYWVYFAGIYLMVKHIFNVLFKVKNKKE